MKVLSSLLTKRTCPIPGSPAMPVEKQLGANARLGGIRATPLEGSLGSRVGGKDHGVGSSMEFRNNRGYGYRYPHQYPLGSSDELQFSSLIYTYNRPLRAPHPFIAQGTCRPSSSLGNR